MKTAARVDAGCRGLQILSWILGFVHIRALVEPFCGYNLLLLQVV